MADKEPKVEKKVLTEREERWAKHVAAYIAKSPKGKAKEARGEFAKIPDTFV